LLADEPTGNLDPKTSEIVFSELLSIVKETGLSALIATHNFDLADRMDRKVRLVDGKLLDLRAEKFVSVENFY
jgi:lipoprotein-releasing system ATP-binding protein